MNSQKKERHRADWINKWIVEYRTEQEPGWMWVNKMNIFRYKNLDECEWIKWIYSDMRMGKRSTVWNCGIETER